MKRTIVSILIAIPLCILTCVGILSCSESDPDMLELTGEVENVQQLTWEPREEAKEPEETVIDLSDTALPGDDEFPEGTVASALTGLAIPEESEKLRPLAVMFGNTTEALPQYGLSKADILYEIPVEGGITRLMGIFGDYSGLDRIGCVRSARLYFAEIATEYDAMYCHFGQAPYAESYLNSSAVTDINGLSGTVGNIAFYRSSDKKAPHNAYVSADGIDKSIETMSFRRDYKEDFEPHFKFSSKYYSMNSGEVGKETAVIVTGYNFSNTRFEYNPEDELYYRFHYKREHIDGATDTQLTYTNVIIMGMNGHPIDNNGYLEFFTVGEGSGLYLSKGRMTEVKWKKDSLNSHSVFYMPDGDELILAPGKTAVCVIDTDDMDRVKTYDTYSDFEEQ